MPIIGSAVSIRSFGGIGNVTGGESEVVENVFSSYLYTGNGGSTATINNGIDLSGEGGLVWIKARNAGESHGLFDTTRGVMELLSSDNQLAQATNSGTLTNFYNNGFKVDGNGIVGSSTDPYTSWTFRKSPKFFDIVTYTGDSNSQKILSHSLGSDPGMVIIKSTNTNGTSWWTWHRSFGANTSSTGKQMALDSTKAIRDTGTTYSGSAFDWSSPNGAYEQGSYVQGTSSANITVGYEANNNTWQYVAYLFAHNDGDGGFGPNGDADIIKCGSYTGNGSTQSISLGFEPQFIILKNASSPYNWVMFDSMRGVVTSSSASDDQYLFPNLDTSEGGGIPMNFTATGFDLANEDTSNKNNDTFIYMAIRRGPMTVPENATDVFAVAVRTGASGSQGAYRSGFPVDMAFHKVVTNSFNPYETGSRLQQGNSMSTNSDSGEVTQSDQQYDYMDGWNSETSSSSSKYSWMWKRAPGFFDVVHYQGNGGAVTVNHNLGVTPEMVWMKRRDTNGDWGVYFKSGSVESALLLNGTAQQYSGGGIAFSVTSTFFRPFNSNFPMQNSINGVDYISYLFASLDGVSKIGSYTGNGSTQNIECGFSNGSRFVLIRNRNASGQWLFWDSVRGISAANNDPYLALNSAQNQQTDAGARDIGPYSSGFQLTGADSDINATGNLYIYYAIA